MPLDDRPVRDAPSPGGPRQATQAPAAAAAASAGEKQRHDRSQVHGPSAARRPGRPRHTAHSQRGPRAGRAPVRRPRLEHARRPPTCGPDRRTAPWRGRPDPADLRPGQGRRVLRRLPRLHPRLGARRARRPLPALRPGDQGRCAPPPQRAPRRREPGRCRVDPGPGHRGPARPAARPRLRLRPARDPGRGMGPGDGRDRPVPQPDRVPPAGRRRGRAATQRGGCADRAELRARLHRRRTRSTRSPVGSTSGGIRRTRRRVWSGSRSRARSAARCRCAWPTARRTRGGR